MGSLKALILAGAASLTFASTAFAADLLLPPPPPVEPAYVPVDFSNGFYLRGDVGAGAVQLRNSISTFQNTPANFGYQGSSLSEQAIVGLGAGYQFNHYFRADVTGEYHFGSNYSATEIATGCNGIGGPCADRYAGKISEGVFLLNGYVDLGTWYRLTPYVGAGVGVAVNTFSSVHDYNLNFFGADSGASSSNTHTNFAYAAMAGVSYALTPNLKLDVGYRYLDMGRASSGAINCYQTGGCTFERQNYHLTSQEVRLGLRYIFADVAPVPAFAPPLVRKY